MEQNELDLFGLKQYQESKPAEPEDASVGYRDLPTEAQFDIWKELPGSKRVLQQFYREAAFYGKRFLRTGRRVSIHLIRELVRDHIKTVRHRAQKDGHDITKWKGYAVCNDFSPHFARHIVSRRPEWEGMFEMRRTKEEKDREKMSAAMLAQEDDHGET